MNTPARFRWLPPGLRPPAEAAMDARQERTILLVGAAALGIAVAVVAQTVQGALSGTDTSRNRSRMFSTKGR